MVRISLASLLNDNDAIVEEHLAAEDPAIPDPAMQDLLIRVAGMQATLDALLHRMAAFENDMLVRTSHAMQAWEASMRDPVPPQAPDPVPPGTPTAEAAGNTGQARRSVYMLRPDWRNVYDTLLNGRDVDTLKSPDLVRILESLYVDSSDPTRTAVGQRFAYSSIRDTTAFSGTRRYFMLSKDSMGNAGQAWPLLASLVEVEASLDPGGVLPLFCAIRRKGEDSWVYSFDE